MPDHIGTRIAYWRRRRDGMTQAHLAGLAGVGQSYISQVEAGLKAVDRRSTLIALAAALQVSTTDLTGEPGDPTDPGRNKVAAAVPAIRAAIIDLDEGERAAPVRSRAEVEAQMAQVDVMRARSEYIQVLPLLPAYLRDAAGHGGPLAVHAAYMASVCLRNLGYRDLALPAAKLAVAAAAEFEHAAWLGAARFTHTLAMPIESAATTAKVAEKAIAELQSAAADVEVRQTLGQMHLSASMACAVAGRTDDAAAHLAAAKVEADSLGDPADGTGFNQCSFGPTNLGLWQMTVAVETGEYGRAIEISRTVTPAPLRMANRHQAYWMTLGRALSHSGKTDRQALVALVQAERAAPSVFALNATIHDSISAMVYRARRRSVSGELRTLARRMGVEIPA